MSAAERAMGKFSGVISQEQIPWERYLEPEDRTRIVPAEVLAQRGRERMAMGAPQEDGLTLPWDAAKDKVLIRKGKLAVWAGWSRHGKTQLLKQLMLHAISTGEKVLIASMEEEILDVWCDLAQQACHTDSPKSAVLDRFVEFVKGKLWLYDQSGMVNPRKIQAVIRYAAKELGVTQAMIDSLMMLALDRDDYDAQSRFCGELKTTAKDTHCTVHLVAHMRKRDGKTGDESPGNLHDVAGGHEIGSKADYVFIPWRDIKRSNPDTAAQILKVEKARGRINWLGTIGLNFHAASRQFIDGSQPMSFWSEDCAF